MREIMSLRSSTASPTTERPESERRVDLHIYVVPTELWQDHLQSAVNQVISDAVSAGFIRVFPEMTVSSLREELEIQLGYEYVPKNYVFLRCVGRCFTRLRPKQERSLRVKHFMPPQTYAPELFLLESSVDGDYRSGISSTGSSSHASIRSSQLPDDRPFPVHKPVPPISLRGANEQSTQTGNEGWRSITPQYTAGSKTDWLRDGKPSTTTIIRAIVPIYQSSKSVQWPNDSADDDDENNKATQTDVSDMRTRSPLMELHEEEVENGETDAVDVTVDNELPVHPPLSATPTEMMTGSRYLLEQEERRRKDELDEAERRQLQELLRARKEEEQRLQAEKEQKEQQERARREAEERAAIEKAERQRRADEARKKEEQRKREEEEEKRRKAEQEREEQLRQQVLEEQRKIDTEWEQLNADKQKIEEQRKKDEERRRREEEERRMADEQRAMDEKKKRLDEAKADLEEQRKKAAEQNRQDLLKKMDEERQRIEQERVSLEEQRKKDEERTRQLELKKMDEERQRIEQERVSLEEQRKKDEERTRQLEQAKLNQKEAQELIKQIDELRSKRIQSERARDELISTARQLQNKARNNRGTGRDVWKKKYFEEKRKTVPLDETAKRLRIELDGLHKKILHQMESSRRDVTSRSTAAVAGTASSASQTPSDKSNLKIQSVRLQQEIELVQRRIAEVNMKLTAEIKLRNQVEQENRALKAELSQRRSQLLAGKTTSRNPAGQAPMYWAETKTTSMR